MKEKENRIEYRLEYQLPREDDVIITYFDSTNEAYEFITKNKLYTFQLVKEEIIAQRFDLYGEHG